MGSLEDERSVRKLWGADGHLRIKPGYRLSAELAQIPDREYIPVKEWQYQEGRPKGSVCFIESSTVKTFHRPGP